MNIAPKNRPVSREVQLMATCLCDAFYADVAKATVEVLEHVGCGIDFPEGQTCCGQPAFNSGDWKAARKVVRHAMSVFGGKAPIIVPSGSCAAMLFHNIDLAFEKESDRSQAVAFGERAWEVLDFIVHGLGVTQWPGSLNAKVVLHRSCHTRGTRSIDAAITLLKSVKGVELVEFDETEQCCGFGGTFSVTFPNISSAMGRLKLGHLTKGSPQIVASVDASCLMHLGGLAEKAGQPIVTRHVVQLLRDALKNS